MSKRKVTPQGDRLVVRRVQQPTTTIGGVHLPDTAQEKPIEGEILAVGPGRTLDNGTLLKPTVKVGEHILFPKYSGTEVTIDGAELLIIAEKDVLAVVDPAPVPAGV